jgi:hypothetical protein
MEAGGRRDLPTRNKTNEISDIQYLLALAAGGSKAWILVPGLIGATSRQIPPVGFTSLDCHLLRCWCIYLVFPRSPSRNVNSLVTVIKQRSYVFTQSIRSNPPLLRVLFPLLGWANRLACFVTRAVFI